MRIRYLLPLLLITGLSGSCRGGPPQQAGPPPTPVQIITVAQAQIEESSSYIASLDAPQFATLKPQVSGQIKQVLVKLGDRVAAAAPLMQIDPSQQQATLKSRSAAIAAAEAAVSSAQATLKSAEAELLNRQADLAYQQSVYDRQARLAEEGAISQNSLDQYARDLEQAKAEVTAQEQVIQAEKAEVARGQMDLQRTQAEATEQQVQLQYYQILAPFAGIVGDVPVKVGDYVTPDTTLTTVSQSRSLELSINIPLEQAAQIQLGMPIQVLDNQNKLIGSSQITFVAPDADPQTQSILVKATYDNSQGTLRADQFVRTRVVWQQRPALVIPLTAVSRVAGQNFVYVVQPGEAPAGDPPSLIAVQKPVRLGEIQGNTYEVIAGLEVNQQIVASGLQKIFDQAPIMDESQMPPPPPGGAPPP